MRRATLGLTVSTGLTVEMEFPQVGAWNEQDRSSLGWVTYQDVISFGVLG